MVISSPRGSGFESQYQEDLFSNHSKWLKLTQEKEFRISAYKRLAELRWPEAYLEKGQIIHDESKYCVKITLAFHSKRSIRTQFVNDLFSRDYRFPEKEKL
jgi:hypothetical protein